MFGRLLLNGLSEGFLFMGIACIFFSGVYVFFSTRRRLFLKIFTRSWSELREAARSISEPGFSVGLRNLAVVALSVGIVFVLIGLILFLKS